jgi:GH25 family lysozyme M1 (1,4-beta-N-acetylmuramidase)
MGVSGQFARYRSSLLRVTVAAALVAVTAAVGAGAAAARVVGPDLSSNNHSNGQAFSWRAAHRSAVSFAFIKATEGRDYVNPRFASDFRAAGRMLKGAYHYARPSGRTYAQISADAKAEANHFIRITGAMRGKGILPPVLDIEDAGTLSPHQMKWWTRIWLRRVTLLTGRNPIIYTYPDFWRQRLRNSAEFRAYPLWVAHYRVPRPRRVGGWTRYTFWQFTDRGRLPGSRLRLDVNVFNGSRAQLRALTIVRRPVSKASKASRASGASRTPLAQKRSVTAGSSRALAALAAANRSMSEATMKYIIRVRISDQESRPRMWPNVFSRGGIREIGH